MLDRNPVMLGAALFALTSAPLATTAAAAPGWGPYFGIKAGGIIIDDGEADDVDIDFDTGFAISGQIGYQFDVFRLEGEFGFQGFDGESDNGVNADIDAGVFTMNGFIDLPIIPSFGPYIGGGFGVATLTANDDFEDEDTAFTLLGEAGLNFDINNQFTIAPYYRYQWIDTDLGGQTDALQSQTIGVSLRYVLNWYGRSYRDDGYRDDGYRDDGYRGNYYNGGGYGGGYGGAYGGYRSYDRRDDRYDDRSHRRNKKSRRQDERDRCGWKGEGCEDEDFENFGG